MQTQTPTNVSSNLGGSNGTSSNTQISFKRNPISSGGTTLTSPSIKRTKDMNLLQRFPLSTIDPNSTSRSSSDSQQPPISSSNARPINSITYSSLRPRVGTIIHTPTKSNPTRNPFESHSENGPSSKSEKQSNWWDSGSTLSTTRKGPFSFAEELKASLGSLDKEKEAPPEVVATQSHSHFPQKNLGSDIIGSNFEDATSSQDSSELEKKLRGQIAQLSNQVSALTIQLINTEEEVRQYREEYEKIKASGKTLAQSYLYKSERLQYLENQLEEKQKLTYSSPQKVSFGWMFWG